MANETFEKFTWTIKNFYKLDAEKIYSEKFFLAGHTWQILMFPKGNNCNHLSIYLDAGDLANLPYGWSKFVNFKLSVINQLNDKMTKTKETMHHFNAREIDWGYTSFMHLDEFCNACNGFIVNDTCIIKAEICASKSETEMNETLAEAEIYASKSELENKIDEIVSKVDITQVHDDDDDDDDEPNELIDFRGLAKIEKYFVPLLEEVCSRYPSLVECQQKRSRRFAEWAFTALGRVLHFLKTKKAKDMNDDDACNHLRILWEELETFRFDLTWLEPHVQSAMSMKSYLERATEVKKLKENVDALEMETKKLKAKMAAAEVDLEIARRELVKAEESFEERNLDAPLGYGGL